MIFPNKDQKIELENTQNTLLVMPADLLTQLSGVNTQLGGNPTQSQQVEIKPSQITAGSRMIDLQPLSDTQLARELKDLASEEKSTNSGKDSIN